MGAQQNPVREDQKQEGIPLRENAQQWRGREFAGENRVGKTQENSYA